MRITSHRVTFDALTGILSATIDGMDHDEAGLAVMRLGGKPAFITIERYHKRRTTGPWSQNHRLNGFISQYCNETGNDFADIKLFIKRKAMRRGLEPMKNDKGDIVYSKVDGEPLPKSETDMNTVECSWCIEEIQQLGAEDGFIFKEVD